jgi:hypothetical protein
MRYHAPMRGSLGSSVAFGMMLSLAACEVEITARSRFELPASLAELDGPTFFDHPFPSDLRREGGVVVIAGWPNPRESPLLSQYIDFADRRLDGFSVMGGGFLRFDAPLDPSSLPQGAESISEDSSVQLIDVDPASPSRGRRAPIYVEFRRDEGVYWPSNTLAFLPVPGYPLRPRTRYALVATRALRAEGGAVGPSGDLTQVLGLGAPRSDAARAARDLYAPAVDEVAAAGVPPEEIVHLAVFTTNDPADELRKTAAKVPSDVEAPSFDPSAWDVLQTGSAFTEYEGLYGPSPDYQAGEIPFGALGDGGGFELDADGAAVLQRTFDLRFSLTVPNVESCPMPTAGYPITLYAHGTGGSYRSYVFEGVARGLAERCIATMGVDQIFHGTRPGATDAPGGVEILFFNFNNVEAARTNGRQSAIDEVQRARLFSETRATVPASVSVTGSEIRFDPDKILYFGHSQGALNGPLYLAVTDTSRGGVFSGASGNIQITFVEKTSPAPAVTDIVKTIALNLGAEEQDEVGLLYPPFALAQMVIDPVDPIAYAHLLVRDAESPKSLLFTEGVLPDGTGDTFAPPRGCEAMANAVGLPLMSPYVFLPRDAKFGGLEPTIVPPQGLVGNLADGRASGILSQFQPSTSDGHFVAFDVELAETQVASFLEALAADPRGRVPALE